MTCIKSLQAQVILVSEIQQKLISSSINNNQQQQIQEKEDDEILCMQLLPQLRHFGFQFISQLKENQKDLQSKVKNQLFQFFENFQTALPFVLLGILQNQTLKSIDIQFLGNNTIDFAKIQNTLNQLQYLMPSKMPSTMQQFSVKLNFPFLNQNNQYSLLLDITNKLREIPQLKVLHLSLNQIQLTTKTLENILIQFCDQPYLKNLQSFLLTFCPTFGLKQEVIINKNCAYYFNQIFRQLINVNELFLSFENILFDESEAQLFSNGILNLKSLNTFCFQMHQFNYNCAFIFIQAVELILKNNQQNLKKLIISIPGIKQNNAVVPYYLENQVMNEKLIRNYVKQSLAQLINLEELDINIEMFLYSVKQFCTAFSELHRLVKLQKISITFNSQYENLRITKNDILDITNFFIQLSQKCPLISKINLITNNKLILFIQKQYEISYKKLKQCQMLIILALQRTLRNKIFNRNIYIKDILDIF